MSYMKGQLHMERSGSAQSLQACKALGLRQDDLIATSDIVAAKNTAGACSALWSVASVCVERCYKVWPQMRVCDQNAECPIPMPLTFVG